ncbi:MAG TPA: SRPBCC family protein, partial [Anaerolineae bacterium]
MTGTFVARATISINAPAARVWQAMTEPELIKEYMFGTHVTTDWKVGSPITYKGEWKGKPYEDKGKVLQIVPQKLLVSTFWSALAGLPDVPANYKTIRCELSGSGNQTTLSITQDNNDSQDEADHSTQNWEMV